MIATGAAVSTLPAATYFGDQPFRLPHRRETKIVGSRDDMSVFQPASQSGSFEPHLQKLFAKLVRPDWVCLDIGANIGLHSLYLASLAQKVVAFEAAPSTFNYLAANRDAFVHANKLEIVHTALWDESTTLRIAVPTDLAGCAFIATPTDDEATSFAKVNAANPRTLDGKAMRLDLATIPARRLDDWELEHPLERLDFIKLDVEGSEPRVLAGAEAILSRFDPCLVTEYNAQCAEACFGSAPDSYFGVLQNLFRYIYVIDDAGVCTKPLANWKELHALLSAGKFWADLLCSNRPLAELFAHEGNKSAPL